MRSSVSSKWNAAPAAPSGSSRAASSAARSGARLDSEVTMRHRQPKESILPPLARDQLLAELRRTRDAVIATQNELRRQAPLSRALDSLFIDIDDIAFLLTGNRDH